VYRQPTRDSGQGSSARASQLRRVARHQRELLKLPRAQSAPSQRRRQARRALKNRIADTLLWNAARRLPHGEFRYAGENILLAMQLNPMRAARPRAYAKLFAAMTGKSENPPTP